MTQSQKTQLQKNQTMKQILNNPSAFDNPRPQAAPQAGGPMPRSFQRSLTKSWLSFLCVTAELSLCVVRSLQDVALVHLSRAFDKNLISSSEVAAYIDLMWTALLQQSRLQAAIVAARADKRSRVKDAKDTKDAS